MSYLCQRPCQNKNTFGYCLTSWCIYPFIANGGSGIEVISNRTVETVEPLKPKTNADRIRSMKDEELTEFLNHIAQCCENECCVGYPLYNACCKNIKIEDWLKQECRC